jgi:hypothetical protein
MAGPLDRLVGVLPTQAPILLDVLRRRELPEAFVVSDLPTADRAAHLGHDEKEAAWVEFADPHGLPRDAPDVNRDRKTTLIVRQVGDSGPLWNGGHGLKLAFTHEHPFP